MRIEM